MEKKILYILPKYDFFSSGRRGRVTHALGVLEGLAKNNVNITVISGNGLLDYKDELPDSIKYLQITLSNILAKFPVLRTVVWNLKLLMHLLNLDKEKDINYIIIRYSVSNSFFTYILIKMFPKLFWVCEVNSLAYHQLYGVSKKIVNTVFQWEKLLLSKMDLVTVVSEKLYEDIKKCSKPVNSRIVMIPNASSEENVIDTYVNTNRTRLIYMGILQQYYDFEMLIEAFKEFKDKFNKDIELHIYGDGPQYGNIINAANGAKGIILHGRYNLSELKDQINLSRDIFVLPYKAKGLSEIGSPIKLYEYMSFGVPIIASKVGQIKEVLEHKVNSFLYDPDSKESLLNCMELAVNEDDLREKIQKKVRDDFLKKHTWQKRIKELLDVLENE